MEVLRNEILGWLGYLDRWSVSWQISYIICIAIAILFTRRFRALLYQHPTHDRFKFLLLVLIHSDSLHSETSLSSLRSWSYGLDSKAGSEPEKLCAELDGICIRMTIAQHDLKGSILVCIQFTSRVVQF